MQIQNITQSLLQFYFHSDREGTCNTFLRTLFVLYDLSGISFVHVCDCVAQRLNAGLCELDVTGSRPPFATRHIRYVLLVNSPDKFNLLSRLLIYLCKKIKYITPNTISLTFSTHYYKNNGSVCATQPQVLHVIT